MACESNASLPQPGILLDAPRLKLGEGKKKGTREDAQVLILSLGWGATVVAVSTSRLSPVSVRLCV